MHPFDIENSIENLIVQNRVRGFSFYFIILILLIGTLASLPFVFVDVSSQARGFVRASSDNVPIISLVSGNIIRLHMKNNLQVKKGDTLLMVDPQSIENQVELNQDFNNQAKLNLQDLEEMLKGASNYTFQLSHNQNDFEKFHAQQKELQTKLHAANLVYNRNKKLYLDKAIPPSEFEKYENDKQLAEEALVSFQKQQDSQWQRQRKEILEAQKNYTNTIQKFKIEKKNYLIKAPISGTITNFKGYESRSFLGAATQLAEISPDDQLLVECQVNPKDIGLIKKGQSVRLQMDAFNYNQWGFLQAEVTEIDLHPIVQNQEVFFRVKCRLKEKSLHLKNGYQTEIQKGMSLTARFIITRRSIFQLLFDKVDQWLNPSIKPV
jgi:multidrug resistance efflux pump